MRLGRSRVDVPDLTYQTVPVWTPDDRGAALFAGVVNGNAANGHSIHSGVRIDARGDGAWFGWTQSPQQPLTPGRLGGGRPVVGTGGTIEDERGMGSSQVQQIFEQRMAARRLS